MCPTIYSKYGTHGPVRALLFSETILGPLVFCNLFVLKHLRDCGSSVALLSLRKHAYSNILKILPPKTENFQIKTLIFLIFLLKT